jgi:hypothetical protein
MRCLRHGIISSSMITIIFCQPHYYRQMPSCFKLVQLLSVRNIKELNNLGKYLLLAEKIRNA